MSAEPEERRREAREADEPCNRDEFDRQAAANAASKGLVYYVTPTTAFWSLPSWVPYFGSPSSPTPPSAPAPSPRPGRKRVWLPSSSAFSIHATWWGYQLYLPPPIMKALDKDMASAEKIAITVHTMLVAIIDKASTIPMPPQLLAVLYVFQFSPLPSLPILSHSPTDARVSSPQLGAAHSGASHRVHCDLHRLVLERRQVKRRRQGRHPRCHMAPPNCAHPTRLGRSHRARRLGRRWRARWRAGA